VRDGYPIIFVSGPKDTPLLISGINEVACRGAKTIVIGEENTWLRSNSNYTVALPSIDPEFNPVIAIIPLQLLAYNLSVSRGFDPDYPRNLSKTLTVD
jgi:glucosamine--fructose-6-phosphate aminotransferase (isomerizing)